MRAAKGGRCGLHKLQQDGDGHAARGGGEEDKSGEEPGALNSGHGGMWPRWTVARKG